MSSRGWFRGVALAVGLVFLYLPILLMIGASFNFSRLVTVWDPLHSPTLKWYGELMNDDKLIRAALLSVRIALLTACGAAVLGTIAGFVLARFGAFRGRALLSTLTTAPLVMPEVITGLAMLILFRLGLLQHSQFLFAYFFQIPIKRIHFKVGQRVGGLSRQHRGSRGPSPSEYLIFDSGRFLPFRTETKHHAPPFCRSPSRSLGNSASSSG